MKRATLVCVAAALAAGLAIGSAAPAAGQTCEVDELVRVPSHYRDLDIEVWVDKGEAATYREGQPVKIRFRANRDCYVVIYDIDTEGFLNLIFPDDPYDDGLVQGGRVYRLPSHGGYYKLVAEGPPGIEYISAIASDYPIAGRLPWYFANEYESSGYMGHDDLEATVYDVGAVRGDPFVAMRDIAYDILPEECSETEYDTDYTYFHVSRAYSHPRYVCYDCHGRASWLDPYDDVCTVVDIRVDLDWCFVPRPTFYYVGPRFWYWRRWDCPRIYVGVPEFWCSLHPRHLFFDHFFFGLRRVGVRYEERGYTYPPARHHGGRRLLKPGYEGRYPDRGLASKPPRHDIVDKGLQTAGGRHVQGPGKGPSGKLAEVRKPLRLGKPEVAQVRGRAGPKATAGNGSAGRKSKLNVIDRDEKEKSRLGSEGKLDGGDKGRSKSKGDIVKGSAKDQRKVKPRGSDGGRVKAKGVEPGDKDSHKLKAAISDRGNGGSSKPKVTVKRSSKAESSSESKAKSSAKAKSSSETRAKSPAKAKSGSESKAQVKRSSKTKSSSESKAKSSAKAKSGDKSRGK